MKKNLSLFLFLAISLLITSCSNNSKIDEILKYTTDKTISITKINLENLNQKFPKEELLNDSKSEKISKKDLEDLKLILEAENNGIAIKKPLYVLVDEVKKDFVFSGIFWLDDAEKFQKSFSKITKSKIVIIKEKNLIYSDETIIGSVKDDLVVLSKFSNYNNAFNSYNRFSEVEENRIDTKFYIEFWERKGLDNENRIKQIKNALENNSDATTWVNLHGIISTATKGYIETLTVNKLLIDAGFSMNLNFEKGKIVLNTNSYFNDDLKKLTEKYYDDKEINYKIVENINIDNSKMYGIGYMSLDFVKYFIKEAGLEATINNYLEYKDINFEDLTNAFTGDYVIVNYPPDNSPYDEDMYYSYSAKNNFLFGLGINGEKANKIINLINEDPSANSIGKTFHNKEILAFSSTEKNIELLEKKQKAVNKKLVTESNINSYSWTNGEDMNQAFAKNSPKFKFIDLVSKSKVEDGNFTSEFTITLDKTDKNAMHYLMGYE